MDKIRLLTSVGMAGASHPAGAELEVGVHVDENTAASWVQARMAIQIEGDAKLHEVEVERYIEKPARLVALESEPTEEVAPAPEPEPTPEPKTTAKKPGKKPADGS